jgi:membrane protein DedA with SNARE-associated domain
VDLLQHSAQMMLGLVAAYPYIALFALVLVEEAGLPLPISGDLLLVYTGYLIARGDAQLAPIVGVVLCAAAIGALLPYSVARAGGMRLVRRFGRIVHLSDERLARIGRWLECHRGRAIVLARQVPGGRVPTSVVAGLFRVPVPFFLAYTAIGTIAWAGTFLLLGARFGDQILGWVRADTPWVVLGLLAVVALVLVVRLSRRVARRAVG